MFLVFMSPFPVLLLAFVVQFFVLHVRLVLRFQPVPVDFALLHIPIVIVLVNRIVHSAFPFLLLVPFMIVLRGVPSPALPAAPLGQLTKILTPSIGFYDAFFSSRAAK